MVRKKDFIEVLPLAYEMAYKKNENVYLLEDSTQDYNIKLCTKKYLPPKYKTLAIAEPFKLFGYSTGKNLETTLKNVSLVKMQKCLDDVWRKYKNRPKKLPSTFLPNQLDLDL